MRLLDLIYRSDIYLQKKGLMISIIIYLKKYKYVGKHRSSSVLLRQKGFNQSKVNLSPHQKRRKHAAKAARRNQRHVLGRGCRCRHSLRTGRWGPVAAPVWLFPVGLNARQRGKRRPAVRDTIERRGKRRPSDPTRFPNSDAKMDENGWEHGNRITKPAMKSGWD